MATPPVADRTAPVVRALKLARKARRGARKLAITFRLSERATVTVRLARLKGRGHRAVARPVGRTRTVRLAAGRDRIALPKLRQGLARGRYRVSVVAVDAAGNRGRTRALTLRVR